LGAARRESPEERIDAACQLAIGIVEANLERFDNRRPGARGRIVEHQPREIEAINRYLKLLQVVTAVLRRQAPVGGGRSKPPPALETEAPDAEAELLRKVRIMLERGGTPPPP